MNRAIFTASACRALATNVLHLPLVPLTMGWASRMATPSLTTVSGPGGFALGFSMEANRNKQHCPKCGGPYKLNYCGARICQPCKNRWARDQWRKTHTPRPTLRKRFDARWILAEETGCWMWTGPLDKGGYGAFQIGHNPRLEKLAHRAAWKVYRGEIPPKMCIDHICRVRSCVNPDHMRLVTRAQNTMENSLSVQARNAAKTHCSKGHPFSGANLVIRNYTGRPERECRTCKQAAGRRKHLRRIAKQNHYPEA